MAYVSPAQGIISGIDSLAGAVERRNERVENTRRYEQEHAFRQEQADTSNAFRQEQAGLRQENWLADFKQRADNYERQSNQWQQAWDMEKDEKARAAGQEFVTRGGPLALSIAKHNPHMAMQTWNQFAPEDQQITALEWEDGKVLDEHGAFGGRTLVGTFANGEQFRYHEDDVNATVDHYYPKQPVDPHNVPSGAVALGPTGKLLFDNRKGGTAVKKINMADDSGVKVYKSMAMAIGAATGLGREDGMPTVPPPEFGKDKGGKMLSVLKSSVGMAAPILANAGINMFNEGMITNHPTFQLQGIYAKAIQQTYDSFTADRISKMIKAEEAIILKNGVEVPPGSNQAAFVSNMAGSSVAKQIANTMAENGRALFEGRPMNLGEVSKGDKVGSHPVQKDHFTESGAPAPKALGERLDAEDDARVANEAQSKAQAQKDKAALDNGIKDVIAALGKRRNKDQDKGSSWNSMGASRGYFQQSIDADSSTVRFALAYLNDERSPGKLIRAIEDWLISNGLGEFIPEKKRKVHSPLDYIEPGAATPPVSNPRIPVLSTGPASPPAGNQSWPNGSAVLNITPADIGPSN